MTYLIIRAGSSEYTRGGQLSQVKAIHQHSQYNPLTIDYDFCVLELKEPIQLDATKQP